MKVADLYIALALIGACGLVGWQLHEKWSLHAERVDRLEQKLGLPNPAVRELHEAVEVLDMILSRVHESVSD